MRAAAVDVRPVTAEIWDDFVRLFEAKGSPHYCWCTPFRIGGNPDLTSAQKKQVTRRLVNAATDRKVWVQDYHGRGDALPDLSRQIAAGIAAAVVRLQPAR